MIIREIQRELAKDGISVTSQAIRDLLRKKFAVTNENKNATITFDEKIGSKIIEYYKVKKMKIT